MRDKYPSFVIGACLHQLGVAENQLVAYACTKTRLFCRYTCRPYCEELVYQSSHRFPSMAALPQRPIAKTPFMLAPQPIPSSSPAFATPIHPLRPSNKQDASRPAPILPILLPPATLRPIAFRTFTKKHNLTLTSSALQALATFVGKQCGSGWREEGLAELVLEEVARSWKRIESKVIVDGEGNTLKNILKQLEGSMSGGRIVIGRAWSTLSRQSSLLAGESFGGNASFQRQDSFGMSGLEVEEEEESEEKDPRSWIKVINAFEQPRMVYNPSRNHFEKYVQACESC